MSVTDWVAFTTGQNYYAVSGTRIQQATALDGAMSLRLVPGPPSATVNPIKYRVDVVNGSTTQTSTVAARSDGTAPIVISRLINGTKYSVRAFAINNLGQTGPASTTVSVTPQALQPTPQQLAAATPPLLFVHGFNSDESAWDLTRNTLENIGYRTYANTFKSMNHNTCVEMGELHGFVTKALLDSRAQKLILVGHSQGGIAARGYLQFGAKLDTFTAGLFTGVKPNHLENDCIQHFTGTSKLFDQPAVAGLITYGTPHTGVDVTGLGGDEFWTLLKSDSAFFTLLKNFTAFPVPSGLPIISIVGLEDKSRKR